MALFNGMHSWGIVVGNTDTTQVSRHGNNLDHKIHVVDKELLQAVCVGPVY